LANVESFWDESYGKAQNEEREESEASVRRSEKPVNIVQKCKAHSPPKKLFWADWDEEEDENEVQEVGCDKFSSGEDEEEEAAAHPIELLQSTSLITLDVKEEEDEQSSKEKGPEVMAFVNPSRGKNPLMGPEIWILDTGATTHSTGDAAGLINMRDAKNSSTIIGNGINMKTEKIGELPVMMCAQTGEELAPCTIKKLHWIPGAAFNLIAGNKLLLDGFEAHGTKEGYVFTKGDQKFVFDLAYHTKEGVIFAMKMKRLDKETGLTMPISITVQEAHERLGHCDEAKTRAIAKQLGWQLKKGTLDVCEACAIGKARQKNIKGDAQPKAVTKEPNGRVYLDISTTKNPEQGGLKPKRPNWRIIVDEATGTKITHFFESKDKMVEPTCELFKKWEQNERPVKAIRMDNAGENKLLEKRLKSKDWQLNPKVEYTARDTPQQNSRAEVAIATLYNRGRAMMKEANIPKKLRYLVGHKAIETATKLDWLVPVEIGGVTKPRWEHWSGEKLPEWSKSLRKWGEAGVVKTKTAMTPKLEDRGVKSMFVGYADDHSSDCYEMLNWETKRIMQTRDVRWLNKMYFQPNEAQEASDQETGSEASESEEESDEPDDLKAPKGPDEGIDDQLASHSENSDGRPESLSSDARALPDSKSGRSRRLPEWAKGYQFTHLDASQGYLSQDEIEEIMAVGAGIGGGFQSTAELKPMKFQEAMKTKDKEAWLKAVKEEHQRMLDHHVFKVVRRSQVPKWAKILSSTWSMKKKASGVFRARLVARGFEQKEGEHYFADGVSSPVVNEASIFIILILMVLMAANAELNDVKGAFLTGFFSRGEELYMEIPEGFEEFYSSEHVLLLLKTIYGLKQAAFEYWKKLLEALKDQGLERSKADPCVYYKWQDGSIVLWSSWVDDLLTISKDEKAIEEGRKCLKKHFDLDEVGEVKEYVGCKVDYDREKRVLKLSQPVLVQSFEDEFELPSEEFVTPAAPGESLCKGEPVLGPIEHGKYRKGVGKLIHLAKYSRADF
jgi:hypothetical protein